MDAGTVGLIAFAAVLGLLALRVPIAFTLASVATVATFFIFAFRTGEFLPERAIRAYRHKPRSDRYVRHSS